ncbi:hypothetical protein [Hoeflea poritis]|uniref:Uncharacterized protein n=1 Tax=Hoeflea poritis TaxID=2993659 RepID=A0ABT4VVQ8_9HYPH|nr:hypothetical protein [Hoeflea poritis]MDA4848802.1 hypothetical protein [Hoeflea poritis]
MSLKSVADKAVNEICEAASSVSEEERVAIAKIVERAVADAAVSASQRCAFIVGSHFEYEEDKAHQLAERLKQEETALIANLMGMR